MNSIIDLMLLQDDDAILLPQRIRLHLRHHDCNQPATCGQRGTGIRGNLHPGMNRVFSLQLFQMSDFISLAGILISWQSTVCVNGTPTTHTFFSCTVVVQSFCH